MRVRKIVVRATLVCGTLDIAYALATSKLKGATAAGVLKFVAEGLFGGNVPASALGASALGLAVHYAIMALMAVAFVLSMQLRPWASLSPWLRGTTYGLLLYGVMYWVVLPLRWPDYFPQPGLASIAEALFAHIALVGLPMAFLADREKRVSRTASN